MLQLERTLMTHVPSRLQAGTWCMRRSRLTCDCSSRCMHVHGTIIVMAAIALASVLIAETGHGFCALVQPYFRRLIPHLTPTFSNVIRRCSSWRSNWRAAKTWSSGRRRASRRSGCSLGKTCTSTTTTRRVCHPPLPPCCPLKAEKACAAICYHARHVHSRLTGAYRDTVRPCSSRPCP